MIPMTVGDQDQVHFTQGVEIPVVGRRHGIFLEERIDQDDLAALTGDPNGGMAEPEDFDFRGPCASAQENRSRGETCEDNGHETTHDRFSRFVPARPTPPGPGPRRSRFPFGSLVQHSGSCDPIVQAAKGLP